MRSWRVQQFSDALHLQVDVHMISVDWEPPLEPRLLWAGDAVLCRDTGAEERGAPPGLLYRAQVLDTQPSSKSASIRYIFSIQGALRVRACVRACVWVCRCVAIMRVGLFAVHAQVMCCTNEGFGC